MFVFLKDIAGKPFPEPVEAEVTASIAVVKGCAYKLVSGKLENCGATDVPTHIAMETYAAPATGARRVTAYPILPSHLFETKVTYSDTPVLVVAGTKLKLNQKSVADPASDTVADGVTDVVTSGVATVYDVLGANKTAGDKIIVRFC